MRKLHICHVIIIFLSTINKLATPSLLNFIPVHSQYKRKYINKKSPSIRSPVRLVKPNISTISRTKASNDSSNLMNSQQSNSQLGTGAEDSIYRNEDQSRLPGAEWEEALNILEKTRDVSGIDPMVVVHNAAIGAYERRSNGVKALQTFEALVKSNHIPDKISFINTMSACVKSDMNDAVLQLYDDMKETNIHPDVTIYLIILSALAKLGDASRSLSVLESMRKDVLLEAVPIQAHFYVIEACSVDSRYEEAFRCFDEIRDRTSDIPLRTYTHLLMLCNEYNQWEKALELFQKIQSSPHFAPTLQVINLILDTLGANYQTQAMEHIWSTFQDIYSHLIPNSQTYNIILRSYSNLALWDRSLTLLQELVDHNSDKLVPQHFIYTLEACLLGEELTKAMNVLNMMEHNTKGKGISEAYILLFSYLSGRQEYEKIFNIYYNNFQNAENFDCLLATYALEAAFQTKKYDKAKLLSGKIHENCSELSPFTKKKLDLYGSDLSAIKPTP